MRGTARQVEIGTRIRGALCVSCNAAKCRETALAASSSVKPQEGAVNVVVSLGAPCKEADFGTRGAAR
jgi:hypothetical protein